MSYSLRPYGLWPTKLLCPWDPPDKNTGVGCHILLQGIFPTQGSKPHLLCLRHCQVGSLPREPPGKPTGTVTVFLFTFVISKPSVRPDIYRSFNKRFAEWSWLVGLVPKSCPPLVTPWTVAHQAPLSMVFPRQEYWSGLPFPSPVPTRKISKYLNILSHLLASGLVY